MVYAMASSAGLGSPPGALPLLGHFPAYARDPLGFVTRISAEYGSVVPFRLGPYPALLLTDPEAIEEVLVARVSLSASWAVRSDLQRSAPHGLDPRHEVGV
jgi:hypothetical protein